MTKILSPKDVAHKAIISAYDMLPKTMNSTAATTILLAIGLQESLLTHRWQVVNLARPNSMGPARSFWQFEKGGLVGVLSHNASKVYAQQVCRQYQVPNTADKVHAIMHLEQNDPLSAAMARLLLWTDPAPIPDQARSAFHYYVRNWRPGAYFNGSQPQQATLMAKFISNYEEARCYVSKLYGTPSDA